MDVSHVVALELQGAEDAGVGQAANLVLVGGVYAEELLADLDAVWVEQGPHEAFADDLLHPDHLSCDVGWIRPVRSHVAVDVGVLRVAAGRGHALFTARREVLADGRTLRVLGRRGNAVPHVCPWVRAALGRYEEREVFRRRNGVGVAPRGLVFGRDLDSQLVPVVRDPLRVWPVHPVREEVER